MFSINFYQQIIQTNYHLCPNATKTYALRKVWCDILTQNSVHSKKKNNNNNKLQHCKTIIFFALLRIEK